MKFVLQLRDISVGIGVQMHMRMRILYQVTRIPPSSKLPEAFEKLEDSAINVLVQRRIIDRKHFAGSWGT